MNLGGPGLASSLAEIGLFWCPLIGASSPLESLPPPLDLVEASLVRAHDTMLLAYTQSRTAGNRQL